MPKDDRDNKNRRRFHPRSQKVRVAIKCPDDRQFFAPGEEAATKKVRLSPLTDETARNFLNIVGKGVQGVTQSGDGVYHIDPKKVAELAPQAHTKFQKLFGDAYENAHAAFLKLPGNPAPLAVAA